MRILTHEKLLKIFSIVTLSIALILGCLGNEKIVQAEKNNTGNEANNKKITRNVSENQDIRSIINIDTNLDMTTFDKKGIHIEGWKLATEETKLQIYIDNTKIDEKYIKYSRKYDLISIVKNYGTYKENPTPNFDIDIPTDNISQGKHSIRIEFITQNKKILKSIENNINIDKNIKSILNIDTNLNGTTFNKKGIHIEGWKLATEETKLQIYIDNNKIDEKYIKYSRKYDLISIVKGYGTYKENATPNFDIDIPTDNISQGKHNIKIKLIMQDGTVLQKMENKINMDKNIKSLLNIDTNLNNTKFEATDIHIEGWKLANVENTKIQVYVNDKKIDDKYIKYSYKYALTSIIKGYGTSKENPTPNFDIDIPNDELEEKNNKIKIEFVTEDEEILEKVENNIFVSKNFFKMHIENIMNGQTVTNEKHILCGWMMTNKKNAIIKLSIDGVEQDNKFTREERNDVIKYFNYMFKKENPTPGLYTEIDFSKFQTGEHKILLKVSDENGNILGEQEIKIYIRQAVKYEEGTYGKSGLAKIGDTRGSNLKYYKYGNGPNVFFAIFSVHGFEDNWDHDGEELVYIANKFYETLKNEHQQDYELSDKWTIYILPTINPDGLKYGTTNYGPGRTTLVSQAPGGKGIDLNRCWKYSGFNASVRSRNYAGTAPFQAYEAQYLKDFLQSHKSTNGQTMLVDLHGWLQQLIGDRQIGMYYAVQFPENNGYSLDRYGDGYLIGWARTALASNGRLARTALIELPDGSYNHQSVINRRFAERYIQATLSLLHGM